MSTTKKIQKKINDTITLDNIYGYREEKMEVLKIIHLLNNYSKYKKLGVNIPRGLIFQGPPGTGKTLFAKAIAGECNYQFYTAFSSDLEEDPLSTLKKVFKQAEANSRKTKKPSLIYIDEIDKLAYTNSYGELADSDAREATRFLLQKLDETTNNNKILIIASTNNYGKIPNALLRSGRFDKKILIEYPDTDSRAEILAYYINNHALFKNIDVKKLAMKTQGMSGADLKTLINNTLLEYITIKDEIVLDDFIPIITEMNFETIGKRWKTSKDALEVLAHEIGHALVSRELIHTFGTVSALKYGNVSGSTTYDLPFEEPDDDDDNAYSDSSAKKLMYDVCINLGGKAAEKIYLNVDSIGAGSDIASAGDILSFLTNMGVFGWELCREYDNWGADEKTRYRMHAHLCKKIKQEYRRAMRIIKKNKVFGLYLIDEIHKNGDVLSADCLNEREEYYKQHKKELYNKYKHLTIKDLED